MGSSWTRQKAHGRARWVAPATAAALLALAGPAVAKPVALIAGPVRAHPPGYSMMLIAGQGAPLAPQAGPLGGGPSSEPKDSLSILFSRRVRAVSGTEVVLQEYTFEIGSSVMTVLKDYHRLVVSLSGSGHSYGTIDMSLAHGKLSGIDGFADLPFRGPVSIPAQLVSGTAAQAFLHHGHVPATPTTPACPQPGFMALFGFTMDPQKNVYMAAGIRPGLGQKITIFASEMPNPSRTAPATEYREVLLTGAPGADLALLPPSQNGNQTNTGGAILTTAGGLPALQGDLSFDSEFPFPIHGACGDTTEGGTILTGTGTPNHVQGSFQAVFDGPDALGPPGPVSFWNPMRGVLIYR